MNKKKILHIIIGLLIIININTLVKINKINGQVNSINNNIQNLNVNINNIQSNVLNTMQQMKEENSWLYNVSYKVVEVDKNLKSANVILNWSVRDLSKDYKMNLLYGEENENTKEISKWTEIEAEDLGNLNYKVELKLPYQKDYQFKIAAKNDKNTISEKLTEISFLAGLKNRININANPNQKTASKDGVSLSFQVDISNRYNLFLEKTPLDIDEDLLRLKDIKIKVYSDGDLKKEVVLMKNGQLLEEKAILDEPFKGNKDIKLERITYSSNIQYKSNENSNEEIEVVVEDYLGRTYITKSHGM